MSTAFKKAKITPNNCVLLASIDKTETKDKDEYQKDEYQKDKYPKDEYQIMKNNISKLKEILTLVKVPIILTSYEPNTNDEVRLPYCWTSTGEKSYVLDRCNMCITEILEQICNYAKKRPRPFHIILLGTETHTLVENTAINLRNLGYEVHIVADCCISRLPDDRVLALARMRDIGCHITTTENIRAKIINELGSCEKDKNTRDQLVGITASESIKIFGSI